MARVAGTLYSHRLTSNPPSRKRRLGEAEQISTSIYLYGECRSSAGRRSQGGSRSPSVFPWGTVVIVINAIRGPLPDGTYYLVDKTLLH